jgi:dUTPase
MGAFQSNDAHDHSASDAFDLTLDVTVAEDALPPRYETPSASQFAIYANETVAIEGCDWVPVRTGLSFGLPFMLILLVRGTGLDWEVQEQVVDYSTTDELVVRVRRPSAGSGAGELTRIVTGTRVALGVVLPIARPSFALYQPATDEGEAV